ncbi:hypothetical protein GXP67_12590 [Rhodocytophaga rosea]|uniref:Uncharacterized protein n=1 Tax=Rhodocytophaga rosea TaxID=2704465 RepID=A0A6C0GH77_9BACT|nr:hypothetical protein [Rhodocytophaga rosea]QHT67411.1 hypothetical protein GXP67_12590 [Rhodocytophaga rosea]
MKILYLIVFNYLVVDELKFFRIINSRILQILNLRPSSTKARVDIIESSLGKAYIFNTYFQSFSIFNLTNTNIEEVKTNNVTWNTTLNETSLVQKIEIFRQLKIQSEKKADKVQSLQFEQLEMDAYGQSLKLRKGEWKEKIVFLLSKYTNEFGLNWWRPMWLLFVTALVFFIVIETIIYYNCYNSSLEENWFNFVIVNNWGNIFYFLDPVHKLADIQSGLQNCSIAKSLDYFSRIFSAFFIIQIISAFRKYYRK